MDQIKKTFFSEKMFHKILWEWFSESSNKVLSWKFLLFRVFPEISAFPKFLNLRSFGNSKSDSYMKFTVSVI